MFKAVHQAVFSSALPPIYWTQLASYCVYYCYSFDKFVWNFFIPITFIIFSRFNICVFMFLDEKMLIFLMHNFILHLPQAKLQRRLSLGRATRTPCKAVVREAGHGLHKFYELFQKFSFWNIFKIIHEIYIKERPR